MHQSVTLPLSLYPPAAWCTASGRAIPTPSSLKKAALRFVNPRERHVAYAVLSSVLYSWQSTGDFLNYGQWKHGATWAMANGYLGSRDADVHAQQPKQPAPASPQPCTNEKV
jgi:hypothetical protein